MRRCALYEILSTSSSPTVALNVLYIIVRLQNTGIYRIYNLKALSCGARAKRGRYKGLRVINSVDPCVLKSNLFRP